MHISIYIHRVLISRISNAYSMLLENNKEKTGKQTSRFEEEKMTVNSLTTKPR